MAGREASLREAVSSSVRRPHVGTSELKVEDPDILELERWGCRPGPKGSKSEIDTIVHAIYTYYIPPEYFSVSGRRAIPN